VYAVIGHENRGAKQSSPLIKKSIVTFVTQASPLKKKSIVTEASPVSTIMKKIGDRCISTNKEEYCKWASPLTRKSIVNCNIGISTNKTSRAFFFHRILT
jgi:hypothetical protein